MQKNLFPNKKCTIVFQPHLFSRTKDFAGEFAAVLDMADEVILLPIYPARELPMEGVTSELILNKMNLKNKSIQTKKELLNHLKLSKVSHERRDLERSVFITAGAGDIDTLIESIKQILQ